MSLKEKFMNNMMGGHFSKMSAEEKQSMMDSMMDKFFSSMSDSEKQNMMSTMMPKMMGNMMGGSEGNPMMNMMGMMMGRKRKDKDESDSKMPWDKCGDMMAGFTETANKAKFATPELRGLFNEWCEQIETEILEYIKQEKSVVISKISEKFNLKEESIKYLLNDLANKNKIDYSII